MKATWDDFCDWLKEYLDADIPVSWESIGHPEGAIVRIDMFKDRPYHVTTGLPDESRLCNHDIAFVLARSLLSVITRAIRENRPYTYLEYFGS